MTDSDKHTETIAIPETAGAGKPGGEPVCTAKQPKGVV